jgi:hypothetical protein
MKLSIFYYRRARIGTLLAADFWHRRRLSPLLLTPRLSNQPRFPVRPRLPLSKFGPKERAMWASKHRHHHLHSDTQTDIRSPRHRGFICCHFGWIFARSNDHGSGQDLRLSPLSGIDVAAPVRACATACARVGMLRDRRLARPRRLVYHTTFCVNSLAQVREAGTIITMPTRAAPAKDLGGGRSTQHFTFSRCCRCSVWRGI